MVLSFSIWCQYAAPMMYLAIIWPYSLYKAAYCIWCLHTAPMMHTVCTYIPYMIPHWHEHCKGMIWHALCYVQELCHYIYVIMLCMYAYGMYNANCISHATHTRVTLSCIPYTYWHTYCPIVHDTYCIALWHTYHIDITIPWHLYHMTALSYGYAYCSNIMA